VDSRGEVIHAIPAAIATNTPLLLGLSTCSGEGVFAGELEALRSAIALYANLPTFRVVGIVVGDGDLFKRGAGCPSVDLLLRYIAQVRNVIHGTILERVPVGHADV
jgi:hypothetical protein